MGQNDEISIGQVVPGAVLLDSLSYAVTVDGRTRMVVCSRDQIFVVSEDLFVLDVLPSLPSNSPGSSHPVSRAVFSPNGACIAVAQGRMVAVYSQEQVASQNANGREEELVVQWKLQQMLEHDSLVTAIDFEPTSEGLLVGGIVLVLWKLVSDETSSTWEKGWSKQVPFPTESTDISADGRFFLTFSKEGRFVQVWFREPQQKGHSFVYLQHPQPVVAANWKPIASGPRLGSHDMHMDGIGKDSAHLRASLLTLCADGVVRLWCETGLDEPLDFCLSTVLAGSVAPSASVAWVQTDLRAWERGTVPATGGSSGRALLSKTLGNLAPSSVQSKQDKIQSGIASQLSKGLMAMVGAGLGTVPVERSSEADGVHLDAFVGHRSDFDGVGRQPPPAPSRDYDGRLGGVACGSNGGHRMALPVHDPRVGSAGHLSHMRFGGDIDYVCVLDAVGMLTLWRIEGLAAVPRSTPVARIVAHTAFEPFGASGNVHRMLVIRDRPVTPLHLGGLRIVAITSLVVSSLSSWSVKLTPTDKTHADRRGHGHAILPYRAKLYQRALHVGHHAPIIHVDAVDEVGITSPARVLSVDDDGTMLFWQSSPEMELLDMNYPCLRPWGALPAACEPAEHIKIHRNGAVFSPDGSLVFVADSSSISCVGLESQAHHSATLPIHHRIGVLPGSESLFQCCQPRHGGRSSGDDEKAGVDGQSSPTRPKPCRLLYFGAQACGELDLVAALVDGGGLPQVDPVRNKRCSCSPSPVPTEGSHVLSRCSVTAVVATESPDTVRIVVWRVVSPGWATFWNGNLQQQDDLLGTTRTFYRHSVAVLRAKMVTCRDYQAMPVVGPSDSTVSVLCATAAHPPAADSDCLCDCALDISELAPFSPLESGIGQATFHPHLQALPSRSQSVGSYQHAKLDEERQICPVCAHPVSFSHTSLPTTFTLGFGCDDGSVRLIRLVPSASGQSQALGAAVEVGHFLAHSSPVTAIACASFGQFATAADGEGMVRLWDSEPSAPCFELVCVVQVPEDASSRSAPTLRWLRLNDGHAALAIANSESLFVYHEKNTDTFTPSRATWQKLVDVNLGRLLDAESATNRPSVSGMQFVWLPQGHFVVARSNHMAFLSKWVKRAGTQSLSLPVLASAKHPALPDYHPLVLSEHLMAARWPLIHRQIAHLRRTLLAHVRKIEQQKSDDPSGEGLPQSPPLVVPPLPVRSLLLSDSSSNEGNVVEVGKSAPHSSTLSAASGDGEDFDASFVLDDASGEAATDGKTLQWDDIDTGRDDVHADSLDAGAVHHSEGEETLGDLLAQATIAGLDAREQGMLLAVAETAEEMLDPAKHAGALDVAGIRFLLAHKLRTYHRRAMGGITPSTSRKVAQVPSDDKKAPSAGARSKLLGSIASATVPAVGRQDHSSQGLYSVRPSSADYAWALLSETQEALCKLCLPRSDRDGDTLVWSMIQDLGLPLWLRSTSILKQVVERLAQCQFRVNREPDDCCLMYMILGRKATLSGLYKVVKNDRLVKFLGNNFQEERWRTAAMKNAYALLGKHRLEMAAAFFILAGDLKSAVSLCLDRLHDPMLAMLICRVLETPESGGDANVGCYYVGNQMRKILCDHMLPLAKEASDAWLVSPIHWILGKYEEAVSAFSVGGTLSFKSGSADCSLYLGAGNRIVPDSRVPKTPPYNPDVLAMIMRMREMPHVGKGTASPDEAAFQNAAVARRAATTLGRAGCATLALREASHTVLPSLTKSAGRPEDQAGIFRLWPPEMPGMKSRIWTSAAGAFSLGLCPCPVPNACELGSVSSQELTDMLGLDILTCDTGSKSPAPPLHPDPSAVDPEDTASVASSDSDDWFAEETIRPTKKETEAIGFDEYLDAREPESLGAKETDQVAENAENAHNRQRMGALAAPSDRSLRFRLCLHSMAQRLVDIDVTMSVGAMLRVAAINSSTQTKGKPIRTERWQRTRRIIQDDLCRLSLNFYVPAMSIHHALVRLCRVRGDFLGQFMLLAAPDNETLSQMNQWVGDPTEAPPGNVEEEQAPMAHSTSTGSEITDDMVSDFGEGASAKLPGTPTSGSVGVGAVWQAVQGQWASQSAKVQLLIRVLLDTLPTIRGMGPLVSAMVVPIAEDGVGITSTLAIELGCAEPALLCRLAREITTVYCWCLVDEIHIPDKIQAGVVSVVNTLLFLAAYEKCDSAAMRSLASHPKDQRHDLPQLLANLGENGFFTPPTSSSTSPMKDAAPVASWFRKELLRTLALTQYTKAIEEYVAFVERDHTEQAAQTAQGSDSLVGIMSQQKMQRLVQNYGIGGPDVQSWGRSFTGHRDLTRSLKEWAVAACRRLGRVPHSCVFEVFSTKRQAEAAPSALPLGSDEEGAGFDVFRCPYSEPADVILWNFLMDGKESPAVRAISRMIFADYDVMSLWTASNLRAQVQQMDLRNKRPSPSRLPLQAGDLSTSVAPEEQEDLVVPTLGAYRLMHKEKDLLRSVAINLATGWSCSLATALASVGYVPAVPPALLVAPCGHKQCSPYLTPVETAAPTHHGLASPARRMLPVALGLSDSYENLFRKLGTDRHFETSGLGSESQWKCNVDARDADNPGFVVAGRTIKDVGGSIVADGGTMPPVESAVATATMASLVARAASSPLVAVAKSLNMNLDLSVVTPGLARELSPLRAREATEIRTGLFDVMGLGIGSMDPHPPQGQAPSFPRRLPSLGNRPSRSISQPSLSRILALDPDDDLPPDHGVVDDASESDASSAALAVRVGLSSDDPDREGVQAARVLEDVRAGLENGVVTMRRALGRGLKQAAGFRPRERSMSWDAGHPSNETDAIDAWLDAESQPHVKESDPPDMEHALFVALYRRAWLGGLTGLAVASVSASADDPDRTATPSPSRMRPNASSESPKPTSPALSGQKPPPAHSERPQDESAASKRVHIGQLSTPLWVEPHPNLPVFIVASASGLHIFHFGRPLSIAALSPCPRGVPFVKVRFSATGRTAAACSQDGHLLIWRTGVGLEEADRAANAFIRERQNASDTDNWVDSMSRVDQSPPGMVSILRAPARRIYDMVFLNSESLLATGCRGAPGYRNVIFWDLLMPWQNAVVASAVCHKEGVFSLAFAPHRGILVAGGKSGSLSVFDVGAKHIVRNVSTGHSGSVRACTIDPGERFLVTGSSDGDVKIWDFNTFELVESWSGVHPRLRMIDVAGTSLVSSYGVTDLRLVRERLFTCGADGRVFRREVAWPWTT